MSKNRIFSFVFTFFFLMAFIIYAILNPDILSALSGIGLLAISLIVLGRILLYISNGLFIKFSAEAFTKKLTFGEGVYVGILSALGNFFGPILGGASIRAVYLKKAHSLSYSKFTSTLMGYYVILFMVNCIAALLALFFISPSEQKNILMGIFSIWFVVLAILLFVKLPSWSKLNYKGKHRYLTKALSLLSSIQDGWFSIQRNKKLVNKLVLLAMLSFFANLLMAAVEFNIIGAEISLPALMLYSVFITVSLLISFTPGAIGIRETLLLLVSSSLGVTNQEILQVALIDRSINFIILFVIFLISRNSWLKTKLTGRKMSL